jgi:hypothetical protein
MLVVLKDISSRGSAPQQVARLWSANHGSDTIEIYQQIFVIYILSLTPRQG